MSGKDRPFLKAEAFERGYCEICASWKFGQCWSGYISGNGSDDPRCGLSVEGVERFERQIEDIKKYGKNRGKRIGKKAQTPKGQGLLR